MNNPSLTDLAAAGQQHQDVRADVCVIGAGAAGLYLGVQLADERCSVVLIEAGPASCTDTTCMGFEPIFEAAPYPGATEGRFFGLGGSTSRWGGALVPHTVRDLRRTGASVKEWSHIVSVVEDRAPEVLRCLGYRGAPDFDRFAETSLGECCQTLANHKIHAQTALYLPFRRKNLVCLLGRRSAWRKTPKVFFNAMAMTWEVRTDRGGEAHIVKVGAMSGNNNELTVSANKFVIAAGAIESARILLELNETGSRTVLRHTAMPGRYLADHLSLPIADVMPDCLKLAARLFAPRFSGAWMHNFRFLEGSPANDACRAFAHFIFSNNSRGVEVAKEVLRAMQGCRRPAIALTDVVLGMEDLVLLSYNRFAHSRLYIPPDTPVHLQLDIEQEAMFENHVSLTGQKDRYGRRVAGIRWQKTDRDRANIAGTARAFLSRWPGRKAGLPELKPNTITGKFIKPYDAYHPVGTCRMGDDAEAVVDYNLKVWGVKNLWVASTGVLPSAGTANPTFTMLCLTHKLAKHLQGTH